LRWLGTECVGSCKSFYGIRSRITTKTVPCVMIFVPFYYHYFPLIFSYNLEGPSWLWWYGSWIYSYLYNQFLSLLMLWVRISIRARSTALCDKVCQCLAIGRWFSPGPPVSYTNKANRHDISSHVFVLEVSILHLSMIFLLVCEAVHTVRMVVGFFSPFFFIWTICVSFKSISITFRKLNVNYVMCFICLLIT